MTSDLEADLRREFDAAAMPPTLTFHAETVLRQGSRTIRRRRIIAAGSAAVAVMVVATGASLLTRPDDKALPLPASTRPITAAPGIVVAAVAHMWGGQSEVRFNLDPTVQPNVSFSVVGKEGKPHELGVSSTGRPGEKPTAVWKSAMVEGHPITFGVFPGSSVEGLTIVYAKDAPYPIASEVLKGTGFSAFYIDYSTAPNEREAAQPSVIASISWSGPNGIVDGLAGDQRLSGRVLKLDKSASVKVVLRPGDGGRTAVSGKVVTQIDGGGYSFSDLSVATSDPSGAAVVTGREQDPTPSASDGANHRGAPIAGGILPPGSSEIRVELTSGDAATELAVQERLPDGRVIFAMRAGFAHPSDPGSDSVKAITWTNADGTAGRKDVTQKQS